MSIDKRVVEMEFDNKKFESRMKQTISSLNELKSSLAISTGLNAGVEQITKRFTNLGIVGVTAIQNITNTVINAGKRMLRSLTIAPVSDGYDDYVRKLTSVQTIMNATGKSIVEVTGYFDQLDEYADKTIYNLDDMTSAFAKFTNAGIELDTSVPAIKGIANMVALAGQNAQAASSAMYNLSQSLSYGSLTTTDYKSLNLANVATKEWKERIVEAAVAAGALKKNTDGMYNIKGVNGAFTAQALFNEKLSEGWVSTETLLKVLKDYGDVTTDIGKKAQAAAQDVKDFGMLMDTLKASVGTGWTDTFELLFGNIEESKRLWTGVSKVVGGFLDTISDVRNEMLQFWVDNEGRKYLLQGIGHTLIAIGMILETVEDAFEATFDSITGKNLVELSKNFREVAKQFKIGADTADKLRRIFKGFFSVIHIGKQGIEALLNGVVDLIKIFAPVGKSALDTAANIGDFLVMLDETIEKGEFFTKVVEAITNAIDGLVSLSSAFGTKFATVFKSIVTAIKDFLTIDTAALDPLIGAINKIFNFNNLFDAVNTGLFAAILVGIKKFVTTLKDISSTAGGLVDQFSDIMSGVTEVLNGAKEVLESYQQQLKANVILKIALSIAILAGALIAIASIDSDKLVSSLSAVGILLGELFGSMSLINRILGGPGFVSIGPLVLGLLGLSTATLILTSALKRIGELDYETISKGLITIGALLGGLLTSAAILSTLKGSLVRTAGSIVILGVALNVLAFALRTLSKIPFTSLTKGLGGMAVLLGELVIFTKLISGQKSFIAGALSMNLLGIALLMFSRSLKEMGDMSWANIGTGLATLAATLTILAVAMKFLPAAIPGAIALGIIAGTLLLLVPTLKIFGGMDWGTIGRALTVLAGTMTILAIALNFLPGAIPGAIALGIISGALLLLVPSLKILGGMQLNEIGKSLLILGGSLAVIAIGMMAMTGAIPGAIALGIVAGALLLLAPALKILGTMSLTQIGLSLLALAGAITVFAVASLLTVKIIPVMLGLGLALALLGGGLAGIGFGVSAFAAGIAQIIAIGVPGAKVITDMVITIMDLLPRAATSLAKTLTGFIVAIGERSPKVGDAILKMLLALYKVIQESTPELFKTLDVLLNSFLGFVEKNYPRLQAAGYALFLEFLHGLDDNIDEIADTATSITLKFIKKMEEKTPLLMQAGTDYIVSFINSMAETIRNNDSEVLAAVTNLLDAIGEVTIELGNSIKKSFVKIGENAIAGLKTGFKNAVGKVEDTSLKVGETIVTTFTDFFKIESPSKLFKELGEFLLEGLSAGMEETTSKAVETSTEAAAKVTQASENEVSSSIKRTKSKLEKFKEWLEEEKYYNRISLAAELEAWNEQSKLYAQDAEEQKEINRNKYRVKNALVDEAYQNSLDWIEREKFFNRLSADQELSAWERVWSQYDENSKQRLRAEREMYRIRKELLAEADKDIKEKQESELKSAKEALDEEIQKRKDAYNKSVELIEERKYYNKLSLREELDEWLLIQKEYDAGSDERKKADREVYRVRNELIKENKTYEEDLLEFQRSANKEKAALEQELYNKVKSINNKLESDIASLRDSYKSAVQSRANELKTLYGIFDKPEELEESLTGEELTNNLLEQVFAIDNWKNAIADLGKRDIDKELLADLRKLGPAATNQIKALNSLSADELQKYVLIWRTKNKIVKDQAEKELVSIKNDMVSSIIDLKNEAADELDVYRAEWANRMRILVSETKTTVGKMKDDWLKTIGEIRTDSEKEISKLTENIQKEISSPSWSSIGTSLMSGLLSGLRSGSEDVTKETANIAAETLGTMRDILVIQSPSKKMEEIGRYAMQGFINGLKDMLTDVTLASEFVGNQIQTKIHSAINKVIDFINNSPDYSPTIRPIMDLSGVYAGARQVRGLLTSTIPTSPTTFGLANSISGNTSGENIRNEFQIANLVVREEADVRKVARELQNLQVTRGRS